MSTQTTRRLSRRQGLVVGLVGAAASMLGHTESASFALERLVDLDTVATEGCCNASINPEFYSVRAGRLFGVGSVEFRSDESEPFSPATQEFGRYLVPASNVRGHELRVQLRYRSIFGRERTPWIRTDVKPALSSARALFLFEGQQWATVTETDGALALHFAETTDHVATVSYSVDGGREVALERGIDRVPLAIAPRTYTVRIGLINGRKVSQRLDRGNDGRYEQVFKRND